MKIRTSYHFKAKRKLSKIIHKKSNGDGNRLIEWVKREITIYNYKVYEREIYNSCILLKNLAIVNENMPLSCDFILEILLENSKSLKKVYGEMLITYRNHKSREFYSILYNKIPINSAKSFGAIISKIDSINPAELVSQMTALEETLVNQKITGAMKKTEKISAIIMASATASVFAILLNFVVVIVFMDTLAKLGGIL